MRSEVAAAAGVFFDAYPSRLDPVVVIRVE